MATALPGESLVSVVHLPFNNAGSTTYTVPIGRYALAYASLIQEASGSSWNLSNASSGVTVSENFSESVAADRDLWYRGVRLYEDYTLSISVAQQVEFVILEFELV